MDNNFSLARKETDRRSLLLASSGSGQVRYYSARGDQRTEENPPVEREETAEAVNTPQESKSAAKATGGDGRRGKQHRQYNTSGESVRKVEGGNITTGRSSKELGIVWPDDRCEESHISKAHYFVSVSYIAQGDVYECKYCHRVKWLSNVQKHAVQFSTWIQIYGVNIAYQMMLDRRPTVRNMIAKIQDFYLLRKSVPKDSLTKVIAAVMSDNEYPYDVEVVEEEML